MSDSQERERAELLRLEDTVRQHVQDGNMSMGVRRGLSEALGDVESVRPQLPYTSEVCQGAGMSAQAGDRAGVFWLEWVLEHDFDREQLCTLLGKLQARAGNGQDPPF